MNPFLQIRLKLEAEKKRTERLYKENQVMKRRLLKYEKPGMLYYNNRRQLND
jgi:hypothetical protein